MMNSRIYNTTKLAKFEGMDDTPFLLSKLDARHVMLKIKL